MTERENTPFVIDFKQKNLGNYGSATSTPANVPSTSKDIVNDSSSHNGSTPVNHILLRSLSSGVSNNNVLTSTALPTTASTVFCLHGKADHMEVRDHCHRQRFEGVDVSARKKLIIASVLCLCFMIAEIIGGVWSNSLAIATDAAHLLTDFASFMISLFAIWIAGRPSTQRMSFGWYRAEVIGAMASVMMIWVITGILVWLAIQRLINQDFELDANVMLITSGLAILVNAIMGFQLQHGHSHGGGGGHSHGGSKTKSVHVDPIGIITKKELTNSPRISKTAADAHSLGRLEDGVAYTNGNEEDVSVETEAASQMPAAGLRTFSYQNAQDVGDVRTEMAAVMAETAPGGHHHGGAAADAGVNINVRAAFIHVLGDMVQSVGVFIAALIIYFKPEWAIADPICTFFFSIIVLFTTFAIMKDALLVLMEGTPSYLHYQEVLTVLMNIEGVERVHNLRIWALSINKIALSVHLAIAPGADPKQIMKEATKVVHNRYNFFETTIQIEEFTPDMENCHQCIVPPN